MEIRLVIFTVLLSYLLITSLAAPFRPMNSRSKTDKPNSRSGKHVINGIPSRARFERNVIDVLEEKRHRRQSNTPDSSQTIDPDDGIFTRFGG
ncbi:hypothetical protein DdX_16582 [Ditylenchus destructor]|uniref:Uncharacterized protein n=1 Tax=Ditylenchus destructor TaxID=166010 RepID=A0AAD4MNN8_9BILA|nr:hypothetical protein DdX_16582 [Ditylenchus destructor]